MLNIDYTATTRLWSGSCAASISRRASRLEKSSIGIYIYTLEWFVRCLNFLEWFVRCLEPSREKHKIYKYINIYIFIQIHVYIHTNICVYI